METRIARCACGQLSAECRGAPGRVSVCHCLDCQRRSGSAFAAQARWPAGRVTIRGEQRAYVRADAEGRRATFRFCPCCGGTIAYEIEAMPGQIAVPVGAFADPGFPAPAFSVWEPRKHPWVTIAGDGIEHD